LAQFVVAAREDTVSRSVLRIRILLLILLVGITASQVFAIQSVESASASHSTFNSNPVSDFILGATLPNVVPADGTTFATSTIIVNPFNGFTGTVTLSDFPLPADLICGAIDPSAIPNGLGMAALSCSSNVAGTYAVTITGISGGISHNTTGTFTFTTVHSADFTIASVSAVSFSSGSSATSNVTVTPQGGFDSQVNLTAAIYPSIGLLVSLDPQYLDSGSGRSRAAFNSSSPGDYAVTIIGTSKSLSHTIRVVVAVTLTSIPDFRISTSSGSINLDEGNTGITRIIITPDNGFAKTVSLVVASPAGVSCSLSSAAIESQGTITLTCSSNLPGDYPVRVYATDGTDSHTTTVNVHVAAVASVPPVPAMFLGLAPTIFYGIMTVIVAVVVTAIVLVLRSKRSPGQPV
jgi:hypothetical protein